MIQRDKKGVLTIGHLIITFTPPTLLPLMRGSGPSCFSLLHWGYDGGKTPGSYERACHCHLLLRRTSAVLLSSSTLTPARGRAPNRMAPLVVMLISSIASRTQRSPTWYSFLLLSLCDLRKWCIMVSVAGAPSAKTIASNPVS